MVTGLTSFLRPVRGHLHAARKAAFRVGIVVAGVAAAAGTTLASAAGPAPVTAAATAARTAPLPTPGPTPHGPGTGGTHGFPMTASSGGLRAHRYSGPEYFFFR